MDPHKMRIFNFSYPYNTPSISLKNTRESGQSQSIAVQVAIDYGILCGSAYLPHGSAAAA
jgi:hypothetical protein